MVYASLISSVRLRDTFIPSVIDIDVNNCSFDILSR